MRPCLKCRKLVRGASYCDACKPRDMRGSYTQRAGVKRDDWDDARRAYLRRFPCCTICLRDLKRRERATVVDHIIPHRGDLALFWDEKNWQSLCYRCHNRKTATQDGGFGR